MVKFLIFGALLLASAAALSGCGVRGPLETPPGTTDTGPASPGQEPHRPFVLDKVL